MSAKLAEQGYDPTQMQKEGENACQLAGDDNNFKLTKNLASGLSAAQKREELVYYAIGFVKRFAEKRKIASAKSPTDVFLRCRAGMTEDCTGTDKLIREVAKIGANQDWCSAFVATISKVVDEQNPGGSESALTEKGTSNASNYASAAKLLAIFDPKVPITSIAWPGRTPKKEISQFLPANMEPVPGCVAIYKDTDAPSNKIAGHMTLVVSVSGNGSGGKITTVEGNSAPEKGSSERGVYAKLEDRPWGDSRGYKTDEGHSMVYQGCVMPWPGDSVILNHDVCEQGVAQARAKPLLRDWGLSDSMLGFGPNPLSGSGEGK